MYSQTWEKYVNRMNKKYVRIQTILRMHLYNYNVLCINNHSKAIGFKTLMQMSVFKILIHSINKQYSTDEGATDLETYTNVLTS